MQIFSGNDVVLNYNYHAFKAELFNQKLSVNVNNFGLMSE